MKEHNLPRFKAYFLHNNQSISLNFGNMRIVTNKHGKECQNPVRKRFA